MMTTSNPFPTFFELERYLAGELDPETARAIDRAIAKDPALGRWIEARRRARASFALDPRRMSFRALWSQAERSRRTSTGALRRGLGFLLGDAPLFGPARRAAWLAIAAALIIVLALPVFVPEHRSGIRVRGGLSVKVAVLRDGRAALIESPARLHPGDQLRLAIDDPAGGYPTVLIEEAAGGVSVAYRAEEVGRLGPGSHTLPGSLRLDSTLGRERIYVVLSDSMPTVAAWVEELEHANARQRFAHGWLPAGRARVGTVEYEKVRPE
jgi:hypothetical protein